MTRFRCRAINEWRESSRSGYATLTPVQVVADACSYWFSLTVVLLGVGVELTWWRHQLRRRSPSIPEGITAWGGSINVESESPMYEGGQPVDLNREHG